MKALFPLSPRWFVTSVLKGMGQIMLQENVLTGILFFAGIMVGSVTMGLAALLATVAGTLTACVLRYNPTEIQQGLYGFSPALVGVAVVLFFHPGIYCWVLVLVGSAFAAIVQHFFIKRKIPVFTLPFVLVTWLFVYTAKVFRPDILSETMLLPPNPIDGYLFAIHGFGQVIFQASIWSGLLFLAGVFLHSRIAGMYALVGSLIAGLLAFYFASFDAVANGLFSYNAVLCAIVFAGRKWHSFIFGLLSVLLSVGFTFLMMHYGIVVLTFPFVLAACVTILLKETVNGFGVK